MIVPVEPYRSELWRSEQRAEHEGLTTFELEYLNESDVNDYLLKYSPHAQYGGLGGAPRGCEQ